MSEKTVSKLVSEKCRKKSWKRSPENWYRKKSCTQFRKKRLGSVWAEFIVHVTCCIEYTMTEHIQHIRTGWVEVGAGAQRPELF